MKVIKRNGEAEELNFNKISSRITKQCWDLNRDFVDPIQVATKVISGSFDEITTTELDILSVEQSASLSSIHSDYSKLASRLAITMLYKHTNKSFSKTIKMAYEYVHPITKEKGSKISKDVYDFVMANAKILDSTIIKDRDFLIDYFGYKTLEKSYLMKIDDTTIETPQFMWMRVACGIWYNNLDECLKTYELMSTKQFTHATPTLFNAGTPKPQMSSCFLLTIYEDSLEAILDNLTRCGQISKYAGGIGFSLSKVRGKGAYIKGTQGHSNGLIPMLKCYNELSRYVDQCFTEDTQVKTDEGYISIKDVCTSNTALTSNFKYNRVLNKKKFIKESEDLVHIKTSKGYTKVTKEHPLLVVRGVQDRTKEQIRHGIKLGIYQPQWVSAIDLLTTDKILKY